jgi:hypothetical protein
MNTIQKHFMRTEDGVTESGACDEGKVAVESQRPMFVKKIFCTRQSFKQNIKAWEGPVKSDLSTGVPPLTDW